MMSLNNCFHSAQPSSLKVQEVRVSFPLKEMLNFADETAITQPAEGTATLAGLFKLTVSVGCQKSAASLLLYHQV